MGRVNIVENIVEITEGAVFVVVMGDVFGDEINTLRVSQGNPNYFGSSTRPQARQNDSQISNQRARSASI